MGALTFAPFEALVYAVAVSCQFYGGLSFGRRRFGRRAVALLAVGLAITSLFAFTEYRLLPSMLQFSAVLKEKLPLRELPPKWGENLSPDQRAASILFAKGAYVDHGKLIEYVDREGKRVRFAPSEEDIEERARKLARDVTLDTRNDLISLAWRRWLTTTIAVLLFGFLVGRTEHAHAKSEA